MSTLKDCVSGSGTIVLNDTWITPAVKRCSFGDPFRGEGSEREGVDACKREFRLEPPAAINNRDGMNYICQLYTPTLPKITSVKLDGEVGFTIKQFSYNGCFLYLELLFTPREARVYRSDCFLFHGQNEIMNIGLSGIGYDPRYSTVPPRPFIPDLVPNMRARCDFEHYSLNVCRDQNSNMITNNESHFSLRFRIDPIPPFLAIYPDQGELDPGSSVNITVRLKDTTTQLVGRIFVPCSLSFRRKPIRTYLTQYPPISLSTKKDEEVFASHTDRPIMQSISRTICSKGLLTGQSVCEKSTRSRDAKLSLASRMKTFEPGFIKDETPSDHYIGFFVTLGINQ